MAGAGRKSRASFPATARFRVRQSLGTVQVQIRARKASRPEPQHEIVLCSGFLMSVSKDCFGILVGADLGCLLGETGSKSHGSQALQLEPGRLRGSGCCILGFPPLLLFRRGFQVDFVAFGVLTSEV